MDESKAHARSETEANNFESSPVRGKVGACPGLARHKHTVSLPSSTGGLRYSVATFNVTAVGNNSRGRSRGPQGVWNQCKAPMTNARYTSQQPNRKRIDKPRSEVREAQDRSCNAVNGEPEAMLHMVVLPRRAQGAKHRTILEPRNGSIMLQNHTRGPLHGLICRVV